MQTLRRYPRYIIDRPLTATMFWEETPVRKVRGQCHVLGEGGLGATLPDDLYMGEVVCLEMPPISRVYARVRNIRGARKGFEFLLLGDGQRQAIRRLCELSGSLATEQRIAE